MSAPGIRIAQASGPQEIAVARRLLETYAAGLGVDLGYQGFAAELAGLPGPYAPPAGALLLAWESPRTQLGCVALRPMAEAGCCEMKRLFVLPEARGRGLGRALVVAVLDAARQAGYREMRLDSLPFMQDAVALYRAAGFTEIAPYYATPVAGTVFLGRRLEPG